MRDSTSLNMNRGRSEGRITTITQENIEATRQALGRNQRRINGSGISLSSFCRIIKKNMRWYPYKMIRCHNRNDGDYERRYCLC